MVDWVAPHGPWDDSLMFVFDGGVLGDGQVASLRILDQEIHAFRFCSSEEAATMLRPYVWNRLDQAIAAIRDGRSRYLHTTTEPNPDR
ncbi:hypothetical protein ACFP2T_07865 [Plantactinospora solaniradicis]|uniref:DUF5753 domain-containing protein n=1 Tax=Plantactinospora solaniradicis TaxID=1723736 RepID=A0ABW1K534_9ACTN